MAQYKFLGDDARYVAFGTARGWVEPGDVIDVDDDAVENYACQAELWEPAAKPAVAPAPAPSTTPEAPVVLPVKE